MPGPLVKGHAKLESDCEKCHDPVDRKKHRKKCLECHKDVSADIKENIGFHGKKAEVDSKECLHCHTEHKGRDAQIILMDLDNFNHLETDFVLKDSHRKVNCNKCHLEGKKYREAIATCVSCHKKNEPHRGQLGEQCETCHKETKWKEFSFDHNKTKFPLADVHEPLSCIRCHANQQWKNLPIDCSVCHKINDVHSGRFGDQCDKCHTTKFSNVENNPALVLKSNWLNTKFDHSKSTFTIGNKHSKVPCMKCHSKIKFVQGDKSTSAKYTCFSCHEQRDEHKTRFGKECEKCHTTVGWKEVTFNHNSTKFPLEENHQNVSCIKCHTGVIFDQKLDLLCLSCHQLDDKHVGALGSKCESCHKPTKWKEATYDHAKTKFPLTGKHEKVTCNKCHFENLEKLKADPSCNVCHNKNDAHKGQVGTKCDKCHNFYGWRTNVFFDHDITKFPLLGLHSLPPCEACHPSETYKGTSTVCSSCHEKKDQHKGLLGKKCSTCHTPNGWKIWTFSHLDQAKYELAGAHLGLECIACHTTPPNEKKTTPRKCNQCHLKDDAHRGKFGSTCSRCHTTVSFKELKKEFNN